MAGLARAPLAGDIEPQAVRGLQVAAARSQHAIAARLQVRHVTIRNHVQHILATLGAHSILEAVAYFLVSQDEPVS